MTQPVLVALELSSQNGSLLQAKLSASGAQAPPVSAPINVPPAMEEKCREFAEIRENMFDQGRKYWLRKYADRERELTKLLRLALLPDPLSKELAAQAGDCADELLLLEVRTDDPRLDYLPFELLGMAIPETRTQIVVWRGRNGSIDRLPVLRFLIVRAAPINKSTPQHEDEVRAARSRVRRRVGPMVRTKTLRKSSFANFVLKAKKFKPGVIHLAMHGESTSKSTTLQFSLPSSNDPVSHPSLANYLGELQSVTAVITTGCFTARPNEVDLSVSMARELVDLRVPAAIGMASKVTPRAAKEFSDCLYASLAEAEPIVDAFARSVLAIRRMQFFDRVLWSVPVLYSYGRNVIPFPNQGYFDVVERLEGVVQDVAGLRNNLTRVSRMSADERRNEVGSISLDMAVVSQELSDVSGAGIPGRRDPEWPRKFEAQRGLIERRIGQVVTCLGQGRSAERRLGQVMPLLESALKRIEGLVAEEYPIFAKR